MCAACGDHVYGSRDRCRCGAPKPSQYPAYGAAGGGANAYSQAGAYGGYAAAYGYPQPGGASYGGAASYGAGYGAAAGYGGAAPGYGAAAGYGGAAAGYGGYGAGAVAGYPHYAQTFPHQAPTGPTRRPGDWDCPKCGDLVFASRESCRCGTPKSGVGGGDAYPGYAAPAPSAIRRPGDWTCAKCGDLVFASRESCRCGAPKPLEGGEDAHPVGAVAAEPVAAEQPSAGTDEVAEGASTVHHEAGADASGNAPEHVEDVAEPHPAEESQQ